MEVLDPAVAGTAPVAAIDGLGSDQVERSGAQGRVGPALLGNDEQHVLCHGGSELVKELPGQVGRAPLHVRRVPVKLVELVPMARLEVVARPPPDCEPRGCDGLPLLQTILLTPDREQVTNKSPTRTSQFGAVGILVLTCRMFLRFGCFSTDRKSSKSE